MTDDGPGERRSRNPRSDGSVLGLTTARRATSPVVGVMVLIGITALLASATLALVGVDHARPHSAPQAHLSGDISSTDGWPDGQRLRLVHEAGDTLAVTDLALVIEISRADAHARVQGFPTRRLTGEHVRGSDLFDGTYAGVDGELDTVHTDGRWEAGERASIRIAQGEFDVLPGDQATVTVVHRPSGGQIATLEVRAS